jgi:methylase of polypeptide subunit release factors
MKPHLVYAHRYWGQIVRPADVVIDATVGNGHDTVALAQMLQGKGSLIGYDIQPQALENTKIRLAKLPEEERRIVTLKLQSHVCFEEKEAKLIVYNLGYLPGGDKRITTKGATTVESLQNALKILSDHGAISLTCYPGHKEGAEEQEVLLSFLKTLCSTQWQICTHQWFNRPRSPTLIWIEPAHGA